MMGAFVLVTWNVLATDYIRRSFYPRVSTACLDARRRHPTIARRARELDADVLCLQEVDVEVFAAVESTLKPLGYAGAHVLKEGKPDGCATFVRGPLALVESRRHVYGDGSNARTSGHVAQLVIVEHAGARVAILNTHLKWDPPGTPNEASWGFRQAEEALDVLRHEQTLAQIMCGDLNVTPESTVMRTLRHGGLADVHDGSTAFTSNANGVAKRIDYVLWRGPLIPTAQTPTPIADDTALPSDDEPSDHVALVARFELTH